MTQTDSHLYMQHVNDLHNPDVMIIDVDAPLLLYVRPIKGLRVVANKVAVGGRERGEKEDVEQVQIVPRLSK